VVTVTATVAFLLPSAVVTVMVAVPFATAVMTPLVLTVAIFALLVFQVTFCSWPWPELPLRRS
jgi:hypothetical protein